MTTKIINIEENIPSDEAFLPNRVRYGIAIPNGGGRNHVVVKMYDDITESELPPILLNEQCANDIVEQITKQLKRL